MNTSVNITVFAVLKITIQVVFKEYLTKNTSHYQAFAFALYLIL
jgi:hypothetical protein